MARELPIHNGRMTTDLDANGFKIKNLPPGSGFTQAQADWSQTDATAPDFIKNKPTIPTPVSVDASLTTQGAAADAKAVGDVLRGGFTEWVFGQLPSGVSNPSVIGYGVESSNGWILSIDYGGETERYETEGALDDLAVAFSTDYGLVTATRHAFPPTKTSQLENDGDGTNAFVKTNDARLSDARAPTAHEHAIADVTGLVAALAQKADAADLPYRLVEPGVWKFSGSGHDPENHTYGVAIEEHGDEEYEYQLYVDGGGPVDYSNGETPDLLTVVFGSEHITATRASLPGHLSDRAGNRVVVSGDTTLTLPAAVPGYLRDFIVRLEISGSTVPTITFQGQGSEAPNGADEITYETEGDAFPVPDEAGDWLYSFTESCVAHKFAVSLKKVNEVAQAAQ